jgi:hypothetical protein
MEVGVSSEGFVSEAPATVSLWLDIDTSLDQTTCCMIRLSYTSQSRPSVLLKKG